MPEKRDVFGRVLTLREDLVQEDVATWAKAYVQMSRVGLPEQYQAALSAAIVARWIVSPETAAEQVTDLDTGKQRMVYTFDGVEVGRLTAAEVFHYGKQMDQLYTRLTTVPNPKK